MAEPSKRRSHRQAAYRKRSKYVDPDTDDDFEMESEDKVQLQPPPREPTDPSPNKRRRLVARKAVTRSKAKAVKLSRSIGKPLKPKDHSKSQNSRVFNGPSDGKIPDWTSLPFEILRQIFLFAHQSAQSSSPTPDTARVDPSWLLKAARTCRAFALPALEAFYQSPSIRTTLQPHQLLDLLELPEDQLYTNYASKIRTIRIDVMQLAYSAYQRQRFDLGALVTRLPRLQHLEIISGDYAPPYRSMKAVRWSLHVDDLVRIMNDTGILLKAWRWSRETIPTSSPDDLYTMMTAVHTSRALSYLTRLTVCGFNVGDSLETSIVTQEQNAGEGSSTTLARTPLGLAASIAALPALEDLTFISCDVIMNDFLLRLPRTLKRLELSNCLEIDSKMITAFLKASGSNLRELVLDNNPALNLSFLTVLASSCPQLQLLKVDMQYYSEKHVTNDVEVFYAEVLSSNEIPSWPASLRSLEIVHAQKWSADGARNLFQSLLEAASGLPDLRSLILHTHINIPWRDRVSFREEWTERLHRVYQRKIKSPSPMMGSLRQIRLLDEARAKKHRPTSIVPNSNDQLPITRPMAYVQVTRQPGVEAIGAGSLPESGGPPQPRRSHRVATHLAKTVSATASSVSATESSSSTDTDDNDDHPSENATAGNDWRKRPEAFIQGLCQTVDVRIDNQRPREEQWTEGDFLDSEQSGDEDYREGEQSGYDSMDGDDGGYAW